MTPLRLIFMGTPDFAVPALKALIEGDHQVVAVYSQPPRKAGRGMSETKSPVQILADAHNIPVLTPANFKDIKDIKTFKGHKADLAVVAAYGLILPEAILNAPKKGCINIHASLLPRWRGAAPIQYAILEGDEKTGISIMKMELGLDTGPVLTAESIPITADDTGGTLHDKLATMAGQIIFSAVESVTGAVTFPTPQDETKATHAPKVSKDRSHLNWQLKADYVDRKVRAFNPWPGAFFCHGGVRYRVLAGVVIEADGIPGQVLDDQLTIACGFNAYRISRLQREGKSAMSAEDYLRGSTIPVGAILE